LQALLLSLEEEDNLPLHNMQKTETKELSPYKAEAYAEESQSDLTALFSEGYRLTDHAEAPCFG